MKAMVIDQIVSLKENPAPLVWREMPDPVPGEGEILIRVTACGVCHTELDEIEGRTPPSSLPMIPGHEVVGRVEANGPVARLYKAGDRVGVGWIFSSCGKCGLCKQRNENLCPDFRATGRDAHGGYAEYMTVHQDFAVPIPALFSDPEAAPLLCAGAVGYRSLRLARLRRGQKLGLTGFGASGHLVLKMAAYKYPGTPVYVFARSGKEREFARELGAEWAGDTSDKAPELLDAVIDTTPVWKPIVEALRNLAPGGRLVINAIRKENQDKEELLRMDYPVHLWMEKEIKSVANVTRRDILEFLDLAALIPLKPAVQEYALKEANQALFELKTQRIRGAKVIRIG
jgi:propanol-preferring alcohol dehydrogenase